MPVGPAEYNRVIRRDPVDKLLYRPFFICKHLVFPVTSSDQFPRMRLCNLYFNFFCYGGGIGCISEFDKIRIKRTEVNMGIIEPRNYKPSACINYFRGSFYY